MKACWERGRPARTKPGTASAISPTWINRERRHGSPTAWPLLFPPTGWLPAASHGSSAAAKGTGCGRDARAPRGKPMAGQVQIRILQKAQDKQDKKLLQAKRTRSMIGWVFEVIHEPGSGFLDNLGVLRGYLFSLSVFLRGPSRTPFESFPSPLESLRGLIFPDYA